MKSRLLLVLLIFLAQAAFAQPAEEHFSTRGTVTRINQDQKIVSVKTEGGLELTFHIEETTQILRDSKTQSFADLALEDEVEIEYDYNPDYEKIVRTLKRKSRSASS